MSKATVTLPIDEYDKLRDKWLEQQKLVDEYNEMKRLIAEIKCEQKIGTENTRFMDGVRATYYVPLRKLAKLLAVPIEPYKVEEVRVELCGICTHDDADLKVFKPYLAPINMLGR